VKSLVIDEGGDVVSEIFIFLIDGLVFLLDCFQIFTNFSVGVRLEG
jgi:hypothetical protein